MTPQLPKGNGVGARHPPDYMDLIKMYKKDPKTGYYC